MVAEEIGAVPEEAAQITRQRLLLRLPQAVRVKAGVPGTRQTPPIAAVITIIDLATKVGIVSHQTRVPGKTKSPRNLLKTLTTENLTSTATINTTFSSTRCTTIHLKITEKYTKKLLKLMKKKNLCCPLLLSGVQSKR